MVDSLLYDIGKVAIFTFVLASMFLTGLTVTIADLVAPFRNRRLVSISVVANFVIVPLIALLLISIIPMNQELAAGLLLVSIAAGAPSTGKLAQLTGGEVARAVSLTILLTIITIIIMPFLVPFILEGAQADPLNVLASLVELILLPILIGTLIRSRSRSIAERLSPIVDIISNLSIAVIFLTFGVLFLARLGQIVTSTSGALAIFVAVVFTLLAMGITYLLGGFERDARQDLAFGAGFRNITAALVVIFASFTNIQNDVLLMVLMVTIFSIIIIGIFVGIIFKKRMDAEKKARGSGA
ncbi:MAG: bile acid:sodium symporter [Methanomicrobiales archaeon]|nr:bile acid:sodium symporter [Methanomicrobiales archaeon]